MAYHWALPAAVLYAHTPAGLNHGAALRLSKWPVSAAIPNAELRCAPSTHPDYASLSPLSAAGRKEGELPIFFPPVIARNEAIPNYTERNCKVDMQSRGLLRSSQ
jgi:hypothetical protein